MEKDYGIRFSDDVYASKDEVKKTLNMTNIDSIWERICLYRSYYTKSLSLKNIERIPYHLVLTPSLTLNLVQMEKEVNHLMIKYIKYSYTSKEKLHLLENKLYYQILTTLATNYEIEIDQDTLNSIIDESNTALPIEYLLLSNYLKTLKYFKTRYSGSINKSLFIMMYTKLKNVDLDITSLDSYYRKNELIEKADHIFIGKHYDAAPVDKIGELMDQLFDFINTSNLFSFCKAIIAYYYIIYIKPFDFFNEEMGFLMFKYVLNNQDNEEILSLINIEKLLDYDVEDTLKKSFLESEEKLDLTYFISTLLPYINASIKEIGLQFDEIDTLAIEDEQKHYDEEIIIPKEEKTNNIFVNNQEENKLVDGLSYEKKVALPTLIVGLDEKDASTVAQHLVELYPTLKRNQAEFFARHCTLGKYYTISQYKRDCSCAYETARTSMDNLVALGFYKKELIKNKFVYTPLITSKEENYD